MKKILFVVLAFVGLALTSQESKAQQMKVGFFDLETMVQVMPGYRTVDSLLQIYEKDSLQAEYNFYDSEFRRLDSTYKADSTAGKPKNVLDMILQQRSQVAINLVYWQQISQNKIDNKRNILAGPLVQAILGAYKKVLDRGGYTLVFKPNVLELGSKADNLFVPVAKELKVQLPDELGGGQEEEKPATGGAKPGTNKPAPKKQ
jgi:Skp family chaperone for outer membrane proteins